MGDGTDVSAQARKVCGIQEGTRRAVAGAGTSDDRNDVNMVIHHQEERLYLYMTAPTEEHFTRSHTGEVADRWLEYMATMMITDENGMTVMEEMDMAFAFGRYKDELDD